MPLVKFLCSGDTETLKTLKLRMKGEEGTLTTSKTRRKKTPIRTFLKEKVVEPLREKMGDEMKNFSRSSEEVSQKKQILTHLQRKVTISSVQQTVKGLFTSRLLATGMYAFRKIGKRIR